MPQRSQRDRRSGWSLRRTLEAFALCSAMVATSSACDAVPVMSEADRSAQSRSFDTVVGADALAIWTGLAPEEQMLLRRFAGFSAEGHDTHVVVSTHDLPPGTIAILQERKDGRGTRPVIVVDEQATPETILLIMGALRDHSPAVSSALLRGEQFLIRSEHIEGVRRDATRAGAFGYPIIPIEMTPVGAGGTRQ